MKTIITYGTFDLFHIGHVNLLRRLRSMGDQLVVGCSTDEFNATKGKSCIIPFQDRIDILRSCRYVDVAFPEENWAQKVNDIRKFNANIFAMGDDWSGKFDFLQEETGCLVTYIARTPGVSTTNLKAVLRAIDQDKIASMKNVVENLKNMLEHY
jgi:glycerol-3-phosphate cytidylyltransferase